MKRSCWPCILVGILLAASDPGLAAESRTVEAAAKPGQPWKAMATRTLDDLPGLAPDPNLDAYGGLLSRTAKATGFFRTEKIGDRWWLVDPEGGIFLYRGVSSVRPNPSAASRAALAKAFGTEAAWAERTISLIRGHGFNGVGAWSDATGMLRQVKPPLVYTRIWNFMASYGKKRGGTTQQPGHTGYPKDCLFVFDPEFEAFCDDHARQLAATQDDPWLLGHFSDNELPFKREALKGYLDLPENDPGRSASWTWLRARHGQTASAQDITAQDCADFQALIVERYFRIVSAAIRKHDPHHLFLGSRFYGSDLRYPEVFKAAGPYLDVVSVNYYNAWTPDRSRLAMWEQQSSRPILVTEWYAKAVDSGMANTGGAGWLVKTQRDRGLFYQNFTLALLQSRICVGWDWFKYADNDPEDKTADPSNRDSNKGIVNNRYEPWKDLLDLMRPLNDRAYGLVEAFDRPR